MKPHPKRQCHRRVVCKAQTHLKRSWGQFIGHLCAIFEGSEIPIGQGQGSAFSILRRYQPFALKRVTMNRERLAVQIWGHAVGGSRQTESARYAVRKRGEQVHSQCEGPVRHKTRPRPQDGAPLHEEAGKPGPYPGQDFGPRLPCSQSDHLPTAINGDVLARNHPSRIRGQENCKIGHIFRQNTGFEALPFQHPSLIFFQLVCKDPVLGL